MTRWTASPVWRAVAALLSGGLWSGLMIGAVVSAGDTTIAPTTTLTAFAIVLGALDSLIVFLLFERFFRPEPAATDEQGRG